MITVFVHDRENWTATGSQPKCTTDCTKWHKLNIQQAIKASIPNPQTLGKKTKTTDANDRNRSEERERETRDRERERERERGGNE